MTFKKTAPSFFLFLAVSPTAAYVPVGRRDGGDDAALGLGNLNAYHTQTPQADDSDLAARTGLVPAHGVEEGHAGAHDGTRVLQWVLLRDLGGRKERKEEATVDTGGKTEVGFYRYTVCISVDERVFHIMYICA